MINIRPAIILKSQFNTNKFKGYIDYINDGSKEKSERELFELKESLSEINESPDQKNLKSFSKYIIGYISNNYIKKGKNENVKKVIKRTTASFNNQFEQLDAEQLKKLKEEFDTAEKRGCVNYQDIISFDNKFLIKNRLYNPKNDELNEKAIKKAIKKATVKMMNKMIKDEKMNPFQTRWIANIHYDTDNIHIHISTTEMFNTRKKYIDENGNVEVKGKRSLKTLDNMKSSFSNSLLNTSNYLSQITEKRNQLYKEFKLKNHSNDIITMLRNLKKNLPENKKEWQYNNKNVKHLQNDIDSITNRILNKDLKSNFRDYNKLVKNVADFYIEVYGENSRASDYIKNKDKELKQRIGNKLLKELKKIDDLKTFSKKYKIKVNKTKGINFDKGHTRIHINKPIKPIISKKDLYKFERAINDETKEYYNQKAYEDLQRKIEYETHKE